MLSPGCQRRLVERKMCAPGGGSVAVEWWLPLSLYWQLCNLKAVPFHGAAAAVTQRSGHMLQPEGGLTDSGAVKGVGATIAGNAAAVAVNTVEIRGLAAGMEVKATSASIITTGGMKPLTLWSAA